jgi:hypothetical protein
MRTRIRFTLPEEGVRQERITRTCPVNEISSKAEGRAARDAADPGNRAAAQFRAATCRAVIPAAALLALAGCARFTQVTPQAFTTHAHQNILASGACSIFPSLDRTALGGIVDEPAGPDGEGRILAGFWTQFAPGAPPFACDRLYQWGRQGAFRFDVAALPAEVRDRYRTAWIEVEEFHPLAVSIEDAPPWDLAFGEGWMWTTERRTNCTFKIAEATQPWEPGAAGWGQRTVEIRDLGQGEQRFRVPDDTGRRVYVTPEVRAWLRGERPEMGFVVVPLDRGIMSKANNQCLGLFRLRLHVSYER